MLDETVPDESPGYDRAELKRLAEHWMARVQKAEEREDDWRKEAEAAEVAFTCDSGAATGKVPDFNILHSNVATIVPSIYNSTPQPDIRPRHNNADPQAKETAQIYERAIATAIDDDLLDVEVEGLIQDGEVAGRGVLRVRVDQGADEYDTVIRYEVVSWRDYCEGPAMRWDAVPWVRFKHTVSKLDLVDLQDEELVRLQIDPTDDPENLEDEDITLHEIWDRREKKVIFIAEPNNCILRMEDDPLGLPGFFPVVKPYQPIGRPGDRKPVCPYVVYRTLAEELDRCTQRINKIMGGLKVRGLMAGVAAEDIKQISDLDDNEVAIAHGLSPAGIAGGMDALIAWWPIERAVAALQQLYQQREATKQAIYEVTGISDIVRGASQSTETATAQQIKTQWGSLRIKNRQKQVERLVRDVFKMTADIMSRVFQPQKIAVMAGVPWDENTAALLSVPLDHFRVDVESDSTVRADLTQRKTEMAEFLQGTAQYFGTMAPLVAEQPQITRQAVEIYGSFARMFNLGKQAEDALDEMVEMAKQAGQQQQQPDPEAIKAQADAQLKQMELQIKQQDIPIKQTELQMKQLDLQIKQVEAGVKQQEAQAKASESVMKAQGEGRKQMLEEAKAGAAADMEERRFAHDVADKARTQDREDFKALQEVEARQEEAEIEREQERGVDLD